MSVQEILNLEKRNENNLYDIHFYLEGLFWRAYEWSAYLSTHLLGSKNKLNPLKKVTKSFKNGYVCVGLQLSSFEKYFPSILENDEMFKMDGKHIIIRTKTLLEPIDFTNHENILNEWKNKIDSNSKKENIKSNDVDSLINEIISYPIEKKNLMESVQFLSYIKDKFSQFAQTKNIIS